MLLSPSFRVLVRLVQSNNLTVDRNELAVYNSEMQQKAVDAGHLGNPVVPRTLIPRLDGSYIDVNGASEMPSSRKITPSRYAVSPLQALRKPIPMP